VAGWAFLHDVCYEVGRVRQSLIAPYVSRSHVTGLLACHVIPTSFSECYGHMVKEIEANRNESLCMIAKENTCNHDWGLQEYISNLSH
jgi:hypothetical protein